MKKLLIGAALFAACTSFSMDKRDVPNAPSPQPIESVEEFQNQFKDWIATENLKAFRGFLQEHLDDAPEYMSEDIVELARKKRELGTSDIATEIHVLLSGLKFGKDNDLRDMEKIPHPTFEQDGAPTRITDTPSDNHSPSRSSCPTPPFSPIMSSQEFRQALHSNSDLESDFEAEKIISADLNFLQKHSLLNTVLKIHIQSKNVDAIQKIVSQFARYKDLDICEVIDEETFALAQQAADIETKKTYPDKRSEQIYDLFQHEYFVEETNTEEDVPDKVLTKVLSKNFFSQSFSSFTEEQKATLFNEMVLICIENLDDQRLTHTIYNYESEQEKISISKETLAEASSMLSKCEELYYLFDRQKADDRLDKARKIYRRLHHYEYAPTSTIQNDAQSDDNWSPERDSSSEESNQSDCHPIDVLASNNRAVSKTISQAALHVQAIKRSLQSPEHTDQITRHLAEVRNELTPKNEQLRKSF